MNDSTFVEIIQAHAAGLISQEEAQTILHRIRPEWFEESK